ncbi:MAG TPA: nitrate reductase molybdenum cofactor assembly chaperone [Arthrobacter sp.]|nr:nitrate reductase molybdenum cofactor assembly chaperone [Arthrobacter sp.]
MSASASSASSAGPAAPGSTVLYQVVSHLLSYPDAELIERLPLLRAALDECAATGAPAPRWGRRQRTPALDHAALAGVATLVDHLEATGLRELERTYVETFDLSRKHALYLSYWTDGDTRRRGEVLGRFKQAYRDTGLMVTPGGELPDYLPLVLEYAAVADPVAGRGLLVEFRPSLEMLRLALEEAASPYAAAVSAVCSTLPGASPADRQAVMALAGVGPPAEAVGLEPYDARLLPVRGT